MSIFTAIQQGNLAAVQTACHTIYIQAGHLNQIYIGGQTVLHQLANYPHAEILKTLLQFRPAFLEDKSGNTPLDIALKKYQKDPQNNELKNVIAILKAYRTIHETPIQSFFPNNKPQCPQVYLKVKTESVIHNRHNLPRKKIFAKLVHRSKKTHKIKASYDISEIHHQLRVAVSQMGAQTVGNLAAAAITFEIKVDRENSKPFFVSFPIKIKSSNKVFTFSDAENVIGSTHKVRQLLKNFYLYGKNTFINDGTKHGSTPKYDGSPGDSQFVNHSEQPLYAYLSTSLAAYALVKRLITTLRGDDLVQEGETIVFISATVHFHSNKVPCGPCEYVIIGTQTFPNLIAFQGEDEITYGLLGNLQKVLTEQSAPYQFRVSKNGIKIFCTYTADNPDATHKIHPSGYAANWEQGFPDGIELHDIPANQKPRIYVGFLSGNMDSRLLNHEEHQISEFTIFSSASAANPQVKKRENTLREEYNKDFEAISPQIGKMSIYDNKTELVESKLPKKLFTEDSNNNNNNNTTQYNPLIKSVKKVPFKGKLTDTIEFHFDLINDTDQLFSQLKIDPYLSCIIQQYRSASTKSNALKATEDLKIYCSEEPQFIEDLEFIFCGDYEPDLALLMVSAQYICTNIYIWEQEQDNPKKLKLICENDIGEDSKNNIHILIDNDCNFKILSPIRRINTSEASYNSVNNFTLTK